MEQTDYLLRQIQMLAAMLKRLLGKMLDLKDQNPAECLQVAEESLRGMVDKDLTQLANLSLEEFDAIIREKKINREGRMYLAEILQLSASLVNKDEQKLLLVKALFIYEGLSKENGSVFSMELHAKIEAVKVEMAK